MTATHEGTMAPPHELSGSLDELLSVEAMSRLEGRTVTRVHTQLWAPESGSASGCAFLRVGTEGNDGRLGQYIVKRTSYARDIIMRLTGDTACRETIVWRGFDERWWQPQLDLALLAQFLRMGHLFMDRSRNERYAPFHEHYRELLAWWFERARAGASWL